LLSVAPELVEALNNSGESVHELLNAPYMDKSLSGYLKALFDQVKMNLKVMRQRNQQQIQQQQQMKNSNQLKRKHESEEFSNEIVQQHQSLNETFS
jgi:hypothetical protein